MTDGSSSKCNKHHFMHAFHGSLPIESGFWENVNLDVLDMRHLGSLIFQSTGQYICSVMKVDPRNARMRPFTEGPMRKMPCYRTANGNELRKVTSDEQFCFRRQSSKSRRFTMHRTRYRKQIMNKLQGNRRSLQKPSKYTVS